MQQSNVIFGALLVAFIVFITLRGELPTYLTILRGGDVSAVSSAGASSGGSSVFSLGGAASSIENQAQSLLAADPGIQISGSSLGF